MKSWEQELSEIRGAINTTTGESRIFHRWTLEELLAEPDEFDWHVRGVIVKPTYGMLAGGQKTLKTHIATFINLGLASGQPVFGKFEVPNPHPVIAYVGEGGRKPYRRRLERIAQAIGVNLADLPLHPRFEVAALDSGTFQHTLELDLVELQPGLVSIDPYYAFHGLSDARNLHDEGVALSMISNRVVETGASLSIVNHFNQSGSGAGLNRITMAGAAEWSDSWWLISHREDPDVPNGHFRLLLEIGSRQWGGTRWDLDLNVGRFDMDVGEYEGDISWELVPHYESSTERNAEDTVIQALVDHPWTFTKTKLVATVGGNATLARNTIDRLERDGRIRKLRLPIAESGRTVKRDVYAMFSEPSLEEDAE
jgi:hypothetical protein